uniref:Interleukin-17 receptor C/E N-terminal domain-containing protein n=1 Tax=Calidris pygmaea TaxID=425635 RepID=A0A8C3K7P9_9CHAR
MGPAVGTGSSRVHPVPPGPGAEVLSRAGAALFPRRDLLRRKPGSPLGRPWPGEGPVGRWKKPGDGASSLPCPGPAAGHGPAPFLAPAPAAGAIKTPFHPAPPSVCFPGARWVAPREGGEGGRSRTRAVGPPRRARPWVGAGAGEAPPRGGRRRRARTRVSGIGAGSGSRRWRRGPGSRGPSGADDVGAGAPHGPGPAMRRLGRLLLLLLAVGTAGGRGAPRDTLACSQGLVCHLLDTDVLCGTELPGLGHGPSLARLRLEPALRCSEPAACSPCLEVRLRLALPPGTRTGTLQPRRPTPSGIPGEEGNDEGGRWSPVDGVASSQPNVTGLLLLSGHAYASSRCVAVEVQASPALVLPGRPLGWVTFRCFEAPLGSELHVTVYTNSRGRQRLSQRQRVPDCSWPAAQAAVPQCQVPRLEVSPGPKEVVVQVQGAAAGHSYTLRLYHNQSHGAGGSGRAVTASGPMNYSLPADEVLPCLCLQVWPEIQDPLRATLCPFSHDSEAWERLWARSRLVLHAEGQMLTCSLSAPCDLPAQLVPCWRPEPAGPCQALPGVQQPAVGQGPQDFGGLRLHPNLCVQVWGGGQVRLTQCLRDSKYCWGWEGSTPTWGLPRPPLATSPSPLSHPQEHCLAVPMTSCCCSAGGMPRCVPWSGVPAHPSPASPAR